MRRFLVLAAQNAVAFIGKRPRRPDNRGLGKLRRYRLWTRASGVRQEEEFQAMVKLTTAQDVIAFAREQGVKFVDYKFTDLPGSWQHISAPISELDEDVFENGQGFDGSSIRGFQKIHESDMLLMPDPTTAIVDPVMKVPTLSIVCDIRDPVTGEMY